MKEKKQLKSKADNPKGKEAGKIEKEKPERKEADFSSKEVLDTAKEILGKRDVCLNCLGRQFGALGHGFTNKERAEKILENLKTKVKTDYCEICDNLFADLDEIANKTIDKLKEIEFKTFVVGTKLSHETILREETLWEDVAIEHCEPIKSELNRELGKLISKKLEKLKKGIEVDEGNPDVVVLLDTEEKNTRLSINPLFVYGGYKKLVRGLPQTKWETYKETVEDIMAIPFMRETKGMEHALHGCVAPDTNILLENGNSIPIESLKSLDKSLITFDTAKKELHKSKVLDYFELEPQKIKLKVFKVKTRETGRRILATEDHEFYTPKGMVAINKLKAGSRLAVLPYKLTKERPISEKVLVEEKNIRSVIKKYFPKYTKSDIIIENLKNCGLVPLKATDKRTLTLIRLLAFLFGDGNVRCIKNRDVSLEFYGKREDLKEIKKDLDTLGFRNSDIRETKSSTIVRDYYGDKRVIEGSGLRFVTYSRELWFLLVALGVPVGDKVVNKLKVPAFIENGDKELKREFLASLLGCEMEKPRLDKRKYNRKSFNTPRFSMNKIEKQLPNGIEFITKLAEMLKGFGVETLKIRLIPYTTRKDGNKSIKIILDVKNRFENLINLYGNVAFRYCKEKEILARLVYQYLSMKKKAVNERMLIYDDAKKLESNGFQLARIHKKLNTNVSKKSLWLWLNSAKRENIKVPNSFPNFDQWVKEAASCLKDGLIWETIESIENGNLEKACDITTNPTHTFFANGFLVSNCGREDIDARCLDWRPFVFEVVRPKKRSVDLEKIAKEINKTGKVEVSDLRFSNKQEVREIKAAKPDKTYRLIVNFEKEVTEKDLEKLKSLKGKTIKQQTPQRVLHRRADKTRPRKVKEITWKILDKNKVEFEVKGEAGLYAKELVHGDNGRTKPSISEILGIPAKVEELDVIKIWIK